MTKDEKRRREAAQFLDNLTAFLADDTRRIEEVADDLRAQGLNPEESLRQLRETLSQYAPNWRERAARDRQRAIEALQKRSEAIHRSREELTNEIRTMVESLQTLGTMVEVGAFYRKFQEARERDLESLLEDLRIQRDLILQRRKKANSDA